MEDDKSTQPKHGRKRIAKAHTGRSYSTTDILRMLIRQLEKEKADCASLRAEVAQLKTQSTGAQVSMNLHAETEQESAPPERKKCRSDRAKDKRAADIARLAADRKNAMEEKQLRQDFEDSNVINKLRSQASRNPFVDKKTHRETKIRKFARWLTDCGLSHDLVGLLVGVNRSTVYRWQQKEEEDDELDDGETHTDEFLDLCAVVQSILTKEEGPVGNALTTADVLGKLSEMPGQWIPCKKTLRRVMIVGCSKVIASNGWRINY